MKKTRLLLFAAFGLATVGLIGCLKQDNDISVDEAKDTDKVVTFSDGATIPGSYIVVLDEQTIALPNPQDVLIDRGVGIKFYSDAQKQVFSVGREILSELGINGTITQVYGTALKGFAVNMSDVDADLLLQSDLVKYIEPDQSVSLMGGPPKGGGGGGGGGQTTPYGITRVGGAGDGTGRTAWIIDSGIDLDHPDLNVDVNRSVSFLSGGGGASSPDDQNGHGTHVAGTIGAINNEIGVVGVAANASVVAVRVLDRRGSGSYSGVIAGVDYVATEGSNGDVANMSLGGPVSAALDQAVINAAQGGVKFSLAAGNESTNANNSSPARANGNNIYTVSAMNSSDNWASFSNYGNPPVDYCAPGVSIQSTWKDGGYNTISGTSMAAPHVAGILLLGNITSDGTVNGDPDGNPDPISHR